MKQFVALLAGLFFLALPETVGAQASAEKPVRLLAEAEDFRIEKGAWQVVPYRENYFASTFAITFLSRMACLGAPEQVAPGQEAIASQAIQVPYDGAFQVLARYEQPYQFSVEFTVEIVQNGKSAWKQTFGRLEDPKIWALNGHQRLPMERYWWGGTDNIVWQQAGPAKLKRGSATLRLIAGPQTDGGKPRVRAARRNVDVICLTNDTAGMEAQKKTRYLELDGWLVQDGDLFVRFTNPKDASGPCVPIVAPLNGGQHSPYYVHVRDWPTTHVLKSGQLVSETSYLLTGPRALAVKPELLAPLLDRSKFIATDPKKPKAPPTLTLPDSEYLQPGDRSGWVLVGQVLDSMNNCQWHPTVLSKNKTGDLHLKLEFAVPDGKGGLKTVREITVQGKPADATFEMPGTVAPNPELAKILQERYRLPEIRTQKEALTWLNAEIAKFPKKGATPKRFLIYNILGFSGALQQFPEARQLALALGDNTAVGQESKKRQLLAHRPDPKVDSIKKMEAGTPGGFDNLHIVSYGDEIHLPALPVTDDELAAWLKERGVKYDGPVTSISYKANDKPEVIAAARSHPLFYYSQLCAKEKGGRLFAEGTAYYRSKGVLTGVNYSPHANYLINEMDYVRPFKLKAMSMPWSEDYVWQIPEFSVQVTGYLTAGLRAGAKYDDLPIHMYVMPHSPGNTPRDFRLSFYTAVAHGAKMINYFCASPLAVGGTENYVATEDLAMWRQIHDCTHEAGIFEDHVMDGKVRPARVGLLLSSVDDVLTGSTNSTLALHNNERKALYYALRHSQVPVDFLSEDDVIEGRAKDYRLIYVTQQWMHSRCLGALGKWTENGGTVVALAGGGFRNEFNQPSAHAGVFYGVKGQELRTDPELVSKYLLHENRPFLTKQDLPFYRPIDTVKWGTANLPVIVWKQDLTPADGQVLATFADGKPAVVEKAHGKGRAVLVGFLPGQAYLKSGLPLRPADRGSNDAAFAHFLPIDMDAGLRKLIVDGFLPADFVHPVECSEPLVETTCIDTMGKSGKPERLAVPLINYTGKPIAKLRVRIDGLDSVRSVRSVARGPLQAEVKEGATFVTLPLDVADMILIDR